MEYKEKSVKPRVFSMVEAHDDTLLFNPRKTSKLQLQHAIIL